uniref:G_PROTEIN_RECEP_F1_2 domain-containing protein n=1 Tax=Rhabditophanes sp. KR3021 TaxID=114890 RepID=A0AC35TKS8_9BILA
MAIFGKSNKVNKRQEKQSKKDEKEGFEESLFSTITYPKKSGRVIESYFTYDYRVIDLVLCLQFLLALNELSDIFFDSLTLMSPDIFGIHLFCIGYLIFSMYPSYRMLADGNIAGAAICYIVINTIGPMLIICSIFWTYINSKSVSTSYHIKVVYMQSYASLQLFACLVIALKPFMIVRTSKLYNSVKEKAYPKVLRKSDQYYEGFKSAVNYILFISRKLLELRALKANNEADEIANIKTAVNFSKEDDIAKLPDVFVKSYNTGSPTNLHSDKTPTAALPLKTGSPTRISKPFQLQMSAPQSTLNGSKTTTSQATSTGSSLVESTSGSTQTPTSTGLVSGTTLSTSTPSTATSNATNLPPPPSTTSKETTPPTSQHIPTRGQISYF